MNVIRCMDLTGVAHHPAVGSPAGLFLKAYDPEAHEGRGQAEWTDKVDEAIKFDSAGQAWMLWRTIPGSRPWRPDGQPNRPLTAFSIEIVDENAV